MFPVSLTKIKTRDGKTLEGVVVLPKRKKRFALIWLHGLSSRFYSGQTLMKELSGQCQKSGIGYFKFNTRGHDIVAFGSKKFIGSAFEKFTDCILDIRAMIRFAKSLGFKNIILAGHSTGANKALYYVYKTRDRAVKKIILLGPISDIAADIKLKGRKWINEGLAIAKKLKKQKSRDMMPIRFGIYTPSRFLSVLGYGSPEDVFPYYNPKAGWKELKSVKIPLAVILGSRDEYLDRPAKKLLNIFADKTVATTDFSGIIIKGASHGFQKKEKELTNTLLSFIKS